MGGKLYGWTSSLALQSGIGTCYYRLPSGLKVEVCGVTEDQTLASIGWKDKHLVGEVAAFAGPGREPRRCRR